MTKKFATLALVFCGFLGKAQLWFDLGVKGAYGPSMTINTNVFDNADYALKYAGTYFYGGKLGINFNQNHALVGECLMNTFNFAYDLKNGGAKKVTSRYLQIPVMYRHNGETGGYTEIGPQFSMFRSASMGSTDVSAQFTKTNYDVVFGFGQYIGGGNVFGLNLGFRIAYTLNDIINADHQTVLGTAVYSPTSAESITSFKYQASHNLYASVSLELNFDFGYFIKGANCHKGTRFRMF